MDGRRVNLAWWTRAWAASLFWALALALASGFAQDGVASGKGPAASESRSSIDPHPIPGEVVFAKPRRFAIVLFRDRQVRRLYAAGDVLLEPGGRRSSVVIDRLLPERIVVRRGVDGPPVSLGPGQALPGVPDTVFVGTVELTRLTYRFKLVDRVVAPDAVLAWVSGRAAVLDKEVTRLPDAAGLLPSGHGSRGASIAALVERVRMRRVNRDVYEVDEASLAPLLARVGEAVSAHKPPVDAAFAAFSAFGLPVSSEVGDGVLTDAGFQITNLAVANTLGIQVGDTVVSLNGRAVNSPLNAWWTFQDLLIRNQSLREIRVKLVRDGAPTTKLYVIR